MIKRCGTCKEHKPLSEFCKRKTSKDGLNGRCRSCQKKYDDNVCRFKRWFESKKSAAKRRGIKFTIKPQDIPGVSVREYNIITRKKSTTWKAEEYPKMCHEWGIELDWGMNGLQYNSPSLDRINPKLGYIPGNVRLVCQSYNGAKSNCPADKWDILEKKIAKSILLRQQLDTNPNQLSLF